MKRLFFFLTFILASYGVFASDSDREEFFSCVGKRGKLVAKVFVDSSIFCANELKNPGTLLLESSDGSRLFNGQLTRWENENGESFHYSRSGQYDEFEIALSLPYGQGKGILSIIEKFGNGPRKVESKEVSCLTKQIHVSCSDN